MISFTQINMQHSKAATAQLCSSIARRQTIQEVVLIQEPWIFRNKICGFSLLTNCKILRKENIDKPRTCIIHSNMVDAVMLEQFCNRDITVAKIVYREDGIRHEILVVSAYFPYDSLLSPPPKEIVEIVDYAKSKKLGLLIGCDANSQHTIWGSTKCNNRGNKLLDFLLSYDIVIQNVGNSPTFVNKIRQEVIDLTLTNQTASRLIQNWSVLDEDSLSDHRYIGFQLRTDPTIIPLGRNPRKTNWTAYTEKVDETLGNFKVSDKLSTVATLEGYTNKLCEVLKDSFNETCPIRKERTGKTVPWWNKQLSMLRKASRKLLNRALKSRKEEDWSTYRLKQKDYKTLLRKSKQESFRNFCSEINEVKDTARLCKILQKDKVYSSVTLRDTNGNYTNSRKEANELLMQTHFPNCWTLDSEQDSFVTSSKVYSRYKHFVARGIMTEEAVNYSLSTFSDYKTPGPDNVYPIMLKKGGQKVTRALQLIYSASLALETIPSTLTNVRVAFIPKPGKSDYSTPKSFRPISLSSFILKGMERILEKHIREKVLKKKPLNHRQHAYQSGRSCDSALHDLVNKIEYGLDAGHYTLSVFIDIQGAFDNATFESMCLATESFGVDPMITNWIYAMLSSRLLQTGENEDKIRVGVEQGCPQGGVLSPLLWCFVLNSLLEEVSNLGVHIQAYADDVCFLVSGINIRTVCRKIQTALDVVDAWCNRNGLIANPNKTTLVLFTRKRKIDDLTPIILKGVNLQLSDEVKYLGVTLDKKLTWKAHVEDKTSKALNAFWICRRAFSKTWGLTPYMVYWIYIMVIRPLLTYGAVVWWPRTKMKITSTKLNQLQRQVCLGITGAMSTTPGDALNAILNLPPLDLMIQKVALKTMFRLTNNGLWNNKYFTGHGSLITEAAKHNPMLMMPTDEVPKSVKFGRKYDVRLPSRQDWESPELLLGGFTHIFFTDGSLTDTGCGAGWTLQNRVQKSYALGKYATVFQTEIFAINQVAYWIIQERLKGCNIVICSDSQASLQALCSPESKSKLIIECKLRLNSVGRLNHVELIWVPGHCGIDGNEIADELARSGSSNEPIGPEPMLGISSAYISSWIDQHDDLLHAERWKALDRCKHSKLFIKEPSKKLADFILKLNRENCRDLVGTLTGHNPNGTHLVRIGIKQDALCQSCLEEEDRPEHKLCNCPAFSRLRRQILSNQFIEVGNLHSIPIEDILLFLKRIR